MIIALAVRIIILTNEFKEFIDFIIINIILKSILHESVLLFVYF
jgi:hypothetical protein